MNWNALLSSLLLFSMAAHADEFSAANALYDAGQFAEAAAAYARIEPKTAAVHFNLGNAHFRLGAVGRAILEYERARQLAPRDPDILANLRFAEERLGVAELNRSPKPLARFWESVTGSRTVRHWAMYEVVALWVTMMLVAGAVWVRRWRTGLVILATMAGVGWGMATAALSYRQWADRHAPRAVVLTSRVEGRFAPLPDATVHFSLTEGTKVVIREDRGPWWLIERADGQQGWIRADAAERVSPK